MLLRHLLALLLSAPFAASALLQDAPRPALTVPSVAAPDFSPASHKPSSPPQGTRSHRTLTVTLTRPDTGCATVRRAALWANGNLVHEFAPGPAQSTYSYLWTVPTEGIYQLSFSADLDNGRSVATTPIRIAVTNQGIDVSDVQVSWLHHDASGSAIAATNALGQTLWSRGYEPFGELASTSGSVTDSRGLYSGTRQFFHGKALDDESGLTYFGARYYDPLLGRFTGFDPAPWNEANLHSFNRYAFANNNPLRFTDPDGRQAECEVACRRFEQPGIKSAVSVQEQADQMGATMAASAKSAASEVGQFVLIGAVTEGLGHLPRLFNFLRGMGGAAKAGEGAKEVVVIGEGMADRVIPTAKSRGAGWYDPPKMPPEKWMENNKKWINEKMDQGCQLLDCGSAPGRANYPNATSPYYKMELEQIKSRNYPVEKIKASGE